ncbi:hypothetical protein L9F63_014220, partial [Diploptera punctata]
CSNLLCFIIVLLNGPQFTNAVPASPSDKLWEEIGNVKAMMAAVSGELEKFNTLYLGKLEYRMLSMASTLSSLDSNVKNLQERAHVWDTFQLHVAAWNDQMSTLDKKVDILSRGQEKMVVLDGKVSSLLEVDYKVERLSEKLDETDNKLVAIGKALDEQKDGPLFGEFTTRGVLSTLKLIERKVDHAIIGPEEAGAIGRGKLVIRCNTPVIVEELLRDVASKVDIIFDKVSRDDEEVVKLKSVGEGPVEELRQPHDIKLLENHLGELCTGYSEGIYPSIVIQPEGSFTRELLWKRLNSPHKKTARALEAMEETVRALSNTTSALWEDQMGMYEQLLTCCQDTRRGVKDFTSDADLVLKKLEGVLINVSFQDEQRTEALENHFKEQKHFFEEALSSSCNVDKSE